MDRLKQFREAGKTFCNKIKDFPEIIEVGIVGSVAGNTGYPLDLDIFVILDGFDCVEEIAKIGRKIYGQKHISMDVFFLDRDFKELGRSCHRKECPGSAMECGTEGCGEIKHVKRIKGFVFDKKELLASPVEILYSKEKIFLKEREKCGIKKTKVYEKLEDKDLECIGCGEKFVFSAAEQKIYEKRGLRQPKRCEDCRERRRFVEV